VSGECYEAESAIVLPAGMELVVPPPARDDMDPEPTARRGNAGRSGQARPTGAPPVVRRGGPRPSPAT
jgi:hypothetical protein